jgi:hypothetical protein
VHTGGKAEDTDMLVSAETVAAAADIADVALEASAFVSAITDQASAETLTADAAAVANFVSGSSAEGAKEEVPVTDQTGKDLVAEVAAGRGVVSSTPP